MHHTLQRETSAKFADDTLSERRYDFIVSGLKSPIWQRTMDHAFQVPVELLRLDRRLFFWPQQKKAHELNPWAFADIYMLDVFAGGVSVSGLNRLPINGIRRLGLNPRGINGWTTSAITKARIEPTHM